MSFLYRWVVDLRVGWGAWAFWEISLWDCTCMTELYNRTQDKAKRRRLRQSMPTAERIVWARLRNRQLADCKFRRQYGVAQFVVDFYAPELKLAIEIDGPTHWLPGVPEYDAARQAFIESTGATFFAY
jgi:very-short-patch-repair endonuclease